MTSTPYKILVVDDEPLIQTMTRSSLRRFQFGNHGIELISAESAAAAQEIILQQPDIAIILLDVVMENETAGLDFSKWVRQNESSRGCYVVLRTGQAGQFMMPAQILRDFPVNDYREKMDLANPKALHNCLRSALITWSLEQEIKKNLQEPVRQGADGWLEWSRLGQENGSFIWAEPPEPEIFARWPLSVRAAHALAGLCDTCRRLRSPAQDKTRESEVHHAPFLLFEDQNALQLMTAYQPTHARRDLVEVDARRSGPFYLMTLKEEGWIVEPWWEMEIKPINDGDYGLWCRIRRS